MATINPEMQANIRQDFRKWILDYQGPYGFGECPYCGTAGDCVGDSSTGENNRTDEWFECPDCGAEYAYETARFFRFARVETKGEGENA